MVDPSLYRIQLVQTLAGGTDPLLFMHRHNYEQTGDPIVLPKFKHDIIMANIVRFLWQQGYAPLISDLPLKKLKFVFATVGTATNDVLQDHGYERISTGNAFTGETHQNFVDILAAIDAFDEQEKIGFDD